MGHRVDLSVIIPVAPGADAGPAIAAVSRTLPRGTTAELMTVTGRHPTRQRNLAAMRARGDALYFLDHDAIAAPGTIARILAGLGRNAVVASGGPNMSARPRNPFEARAGEAIASAAGSPAVADRYRPAGAERDANERSLILCNLAVRRRVFTAAGGFDPRLYPNEENELLNRLLAGNARARHVPDAPVAKPRPASLAAFARESFRYGRGRAEQMWIGFRSSDAGLLWAGLGGMLGALMNPLAVMRLAAWSAGFAAGMAAGWRKRWIRLQPSAVTLRRYDVLRGRAPRLIEYAILNIGSLSKGGYASA